MKKIKKIKTKKSFFLPNNKKLIVKLYQGDREDILNNSLLLALEI